MNENVEKNTELLGVKVKPSTKESITQITEKAKTAGMIEYNGDIFDLFIERFQHDELSKKMEYGADLKELQQITRRINDIFIHLAERNDTNMINIQNQHEEIVAGLKAEIIELKINRKEFQDKLTEKNSEFIELTNTLKVNFRRIKELEEVQNGLSERIEEQKSIIDDKSNQIINKNELIFQKEEAIAMMKNDIALNGELKKTIDSLNADIVHLNQTIELKNEELQKQKDNLEFACQKRVFAREQELNKETAEEIKQLQAIHAKEIREIQGQVNRYQERYENILDEKDKLKSAQYELKVTLDQVQSQNKQKDATLEDLTIKIEELENQLKGKNVEE